MCGTDGGGDSGAGKEVPALDADRLDVDQHAASRALGIRRAPRSAGRPGRHSRRSPLPSWARLPDVTGMRWVMQPEVQSMSNRLYGIKRDRWTELEPGTRQRMIVSASVLIRERGARATSIDDVLEHSGAPRGSVYHHFPGGREQLLRNATDFAREYVARRLGRVGGDGPLAAIDALYDWYRECLVESKTSSRPLPVVAVAVESPREGPDLRDAAREAFERWRRLLASEIEAAGIDASRADEARDGGSCRVRGRSDPQPDLPRPCPT